MTDRPVRAQILAGHVRDLAWKLAEIMPPIEPGPAYWLESDSGESYCRHHAIEARAEEFGLGPLIDPDKPWFFRTDLEDAFWDGISATRDGECDHTEHCSVCGEPLSYILTDYGFEQEIDHWISQPSEVTTSGHVRQ